MHFSQNQFAVCVVYEGKSRRVATRDCTNVDIELQLVLKKGFESASEILSIPHNKKSGGADLKL
jgi:hypothetical protein